MDVLVPSARINCGAPRRSPGNLEDLRVLLVEDEPNTREATRVLVENRGAHVQMAESAAAAREACKVQPPDIIVSDIGLPGDDRYFLIQHIRAWEAERELQRVSAHATAFARAEDRDHALVAGYDSHMG
jgi:CheY-like chemotaxis protein